MFSASVLATKGLGRRIACAHWTDVEPQTAAWAAKAPNTVDARHKCNQRFSLGGEKGDRPGKECIENPWGTSPEPATNS